MTEGRLLIVDDSKQGTDVLRLLLEDEGFEVHVANTGQEALILIARRPPDVVILDVMMPGMTGIEVLRTIRADPITAELPVIMVTALGDSSDIVRGLEMGANDYIAKPPQFEVLAARVRTQLKLKRLQDQRNKDIVALRQLDAIKDKFFQIAAHDLKSPLQNLAVGVTMVKDITNEHDIPAPELDLVLQTMDDAIDMMVTVVNDFLDVQSMRSGRIDLEREPHDFNAVARRALNQFKHHANEKNITFRTAFDEELGVFSFDANRITQVMSNLISNAIKFSPSETTVDVRSIKVGEVVRFEVEDDGPGIPAEEIPLLFQEFARLSNTPTGGEKSSGVGLAIARYLVEEHSGEIGCHSVHGEGSLFWFQLPLEQDDPNE